jgi:hypothetical protein
MLKNVNFPDTLYHPLGSINGQKLLLADEDEVCHLNLEV